MMDDKFQQHYRQQMSALMDGELAPDQARFLMRRMGEDNALNDTWERWQLCGDVLRGQGQAPAPQGFAGRVASAIAEQSVQPAANQEYRRSNQRLLRWGSGAIAASMALFAFLMAGQQGRPQAEAGAELAKVTSAPPAERAMPAPPADPDNVANASAGLGASALAVANRPRRADGNGRRASPTRNQQAARATANVTRQALASVNAAQDGAAASAGPAHAQDPFSGAAVSARPWPRASLPQFRAGAGYTAGYAFGEQAPYYPFQPRLPETPSAAPSAAGDQAGPRR